MTVSIAQKPIAIAIDERTKLRRLMLNLRRQRSTSRSSRCMIASCSLVGGGGMYSSLETGRTSTGSPSHWSGQDRLHLIIGCVPLLVSASYSTTLKAPRIDGWMRQKYVTISPGL